MSKHNKVNKSNYDQGGRLTPDDMARERVNQGQLTGRAKGKENVIGKMGDRSGERGSNRSRNGREE